MTRVNSVNMDAGQIINIVIGGFIVGLIWKFWDRINLYFPSISLNTGLKVSGQWKTTFEEDGKTFHEIVTIKQWGKNINGEIILKEPEEENTKYRISGTFQNRILAGTYESNDPTDYESVRVPF